MYLFAGENKVSTVARIEWEPVSQGRIHSHAVAVIQGIPVAGRIHSNYVPNFPLCCIPQKLIVVVEESTYRHLY
jgi:hypothetical protein